MKKFLRTLVFLALAAALVALVVLGRSNRVLRLKVRDLGDEIRQQEVERRIADLAPHGGYILAPVHNVQGDVPAANLVAMYRHAVEVGRYPLEVPAR